MRVTTRRLTGALPLLLAALVPATAHAQQTLTGYSGPVKVQGSISGSSSAEVRAYVNGLKVADTTSGSTGGYEISFELDGALDQTAVIWYLPDDTEKVPSIVVVKESSSARLNGVWSPCLPRLKPQDVIIHNVTFVTQRDLFKELEDSDCWDE